MNGIQALQFATALFRAAAGPGDANFVCSPWSVACALGALAPGTEVPAREEIAAAVGASGWLRREAAGVTESSTGDDAVLELANRLWVDEGRVPNPSFLAELGEWAGSRCAHRPDQT